MGKLQQLQQRISPNVRAAEPLAPHTTYRIGGPADYFLAVQTADEAVLAVRIAGEFGLPFYVLGGGSNILVSDEGFRGLVIKMDNRGVEIDGQVVRVEAGTPTALVAVKSVEAGLTGFEWAVGLPGTIGGAVRGNAGCYGGETGESVREVRVLRDSEEIVLHREDCGFDYRQSVFKSQPGQVILSVTFELVPGDRQIGQARLKEVMDDKRTAQPTAYPTSGCVFQNWRPDSKQDLVELRHWLDLDSGEEVPLTKQGTVPAGWILDRAQFKGLNVGPVRVSEKHANFFVNEGGAKAGDVIALVGLVKSRLREMADGRVNLLEEIEYVGF